MNFSEFLREEEELELLDEGLVGGALRAVGGFGGNLVGQTAKGVANMAVGAGRTLKGVGRVGLGAVQGLTGGGGKAVSNIGGGVRDVASGVGSALTGAAQTAGALSGVTPVMRGVQAATERGVSPMSSRRTGLQQAMGLNSWTPDADLFADLKHRYAQASKAGDGDLKRRIRAQMEKADPVAYQELIRKSNVARAERDRLRWKGVADRVQDQEPPEDFLRGLSAGK